MIPTPDLIHLSSRDYDLIYEPSEDTFLLLDALESDAESLRFLKPLICLEIGSGSGCVSSFIAQILGPSVLYLCTDINPHACRCSQGTGKQNKVLLDCVNTTFATALSTRLWHRVDVVLFNPPYVPTMPEEAQNAQQVGSLSGAWAGGQDGMRITNIFLDQVENLLSDNGRFYLVALKQNNISEIRQRMLQQYHLNNRYTTASRSRTSIRVVLHSRNRHKRYLGYRNRGHDVGLSCYLGRVITQVKNSDVAGAVFAQ